MESEAPAGREVERRARHDLAPPARACRRLNSSDAGAVADLEARSFDQPWSLGMIEMELQQPTSVACGITAASSQAEPLIAYALFRILAPVADLNRVAVANEHRRLGVGRRLLESSHTLLSSLGCIECLLDVRSTNMEALGLYQGLGYVQIGRRSKYYPDGTDALLLRCKFTTNPSVADPVP